MFYTLFILLFCIYSCQFVAYIFVYWFNRRIRPVAVAVATQKFVADVASERKATNRGTAKAKQEAAKGNLLAHFRFWHVRQVMVFYLLDHDLNIIFLEIG